MGQASGTTQRPGALVADLPARLQRLTEAAVAVNSPMSLSEMLAEITRRARSVVGAHQAVTSTTDATDDDWRQTNVTVSLSERYARLGELVLSEHASPLYRLVCAHNQVVRRTDAALRASGDVPDDPDPHLPLRGWLAAPLVARDGSNLGVLQLSDPIGDEFDDDDEALVVQLAQLASAAIEKARLLEDAQRHVDQLRGLTDASLEINAPVSVDEVLDRIVSAAASLLRADAARMHLDADHRHSVGPVEVSTGAGEDGSGGASPDPWPDALAAPLLDAEGERVGLLEVRGGQRPPFGEADEALLVQLTHVASNAISKAQLAERLAAQETARFREELLSGISHDMQTPLATIVGLSDLLVRDRELGTLERESIHETISRQARALRSLVQQFLDFSRLESERPLLVRPRPTAVVEAVDRVVSLFEHQRDIVVGAAHGLPPVALDPDRLDQVLANLVSNAIKYSTGPVRIVARHDGDRVLIDVVDEGPGISEHDRERLFDKFHRGESSTGTPGTGLGLYITRALVEAQGGRVDVHSSLEVGSRFTVSFPTAGNPG